MNYHFYDIGWLNIEILVVFFFYYSNNDATENEMSPLNYLHNHVEMFILKKYFGITCFKYANNYLSEELSFGSL